MLSYQDDEENGLREAGARCVFFSWRSGGFPRHRVFAKVSVYARACYALACNVRVWWVRRFSQRVVDSLGLLNTG